MNTSQRVHLAVLIGVLMLGFLIGSVTGAWNAAGWLVAGVAIIFHGGAFAALVAWFVRRVKRQRAEDTGH